MNKLIIPIIVILIIAAIGAFFVLQRPGLPGQPFTQKTKDLEANKAKNDISLSLDEICPMLSRDKVEIHQPIKPFSSVSIWNRLIPDNAVYANVHEAIFGDSDFAPKRVLPDLVTICYADQKQPLINIEKSADWNYPGRSKSTGKILYQRHLSSNACGCVNWNKVGNGFFVLIDPLTNLADLGVGAWRIFKGPLLNFPNDGSAAHNIDIINGNGITGYGRASSLPALGGLIRVGELNSVIKHAVAIAMPPNRFSSEKHYIWPAQSADSFANQVYQGKDSNYAIGTLLAIPSLVDINNMIWKTKQGLNFAKAAQKYGLYIVDSIPSTDGSFTIAIEDEAARFDLGYNIDLDTGNKTVDPKKIDIYDFTADLVQILSNISAVVSNKP